MTPIMTNLCLFKDLYLCSIRCSIALLCLVHNGLLDSVMLTSLQESEWCNIYWIVNSGTTVVNSCKVKNDVGVGLVPTSISFSKELLYLWLPFNWVNIFDFFNGFFKRFLFFLLLATYLDPWMLYKFYWLYIKHCFFQVCSYNS